MASSRGSIRAIGLKVDHTAIASAAAAATKRELERAGELGERLIRIWQYAVGSEAVLEQLEAALTDVETMVGIDAEGQPLPGDGDDEDDDKVDVPDDGAQGLR